MNSAPVIFEDFDDAPSTNPTEHPSYSLGYEAGLRAAEQNQDAMAAQALGDIAASLSQISFGVSEARLHVLSSLQPLIAQVSDVILPVVLKETYAAHLCEIIEDRFEAATRSAVEVAVAPDIAPSILGALSEQTDIGVGITSDPTVPSGTVILRHQDHCEMIDFATLIEQLKAALGGQDLEERALAHG